MSELLAEAVAAADHRCGGIGRVFDFCHFAAWPGDLVACDTFYLKRLGRAYHSPPSTPP